MLNIHPIKIAFLVQVKIIWKLAYLGLKMTLLNQKHKIIMKVTDLGVSKLRILFKDIKSSEKLPISVFRIDVISLYL